MEDVGDAGTAGTAKKGEKEKKKWKISWGFLLSPGFRLREGERGFTCKNQIVRMADASIICFRAVCSLRTIPISITRMD